MNIDFLSKLRIYQSYFSRNLSLFVILSALPLVFTYFPLQDLMILYFILISIAFPFILINSILFNYQSLFYDYLESIARICPEDRSGRYVKNGYSYELNIKYNTSAILASLLILLSSLLFLEKIFNNFLFNAIIYLSIVPISISIILHYTAFPDIFPKTHLKAFGLLELYESSVSKSKAASFVLSYILSLTYFLMIKNPILMLSKSISLMFLVLVIVIILYFLFNFITIITFISRRLHLGMYVLSLVLSFASSFILGVFLSVVIEKYDIGDINAMYIYSMGVLTCLVSCLFFLKKSISSLSGEIIKIFVSKHSDELEFAVEPLYAMEKVFLTAFAILIIGYFLVPLIDSLTLNNFLALSYSFILDNLIIIFYLLSVTLIVAILPIRKIINYIAEDFSRRLEECHERMKMKRKILKKRKGREMRKAKRRVTRASLDDVEVYLKEFEDIFREFEV